VAYVSFPPIAAIRAFAIVHPMSKKPLDQFWVLTDEQAGERIAYVSVAYHRTHHHADGQSFMAISPSFKTAAETKSHIKAMIADLNAALGAVDAAFKARD